MSEDARFEDGTDKPLRLMAADGDDLQVISALVQDAVFPISEMAYRARERRFDLLINRFRWEDRARQGSPERTQAVLSFEDVRRVASQGVDRAETEMVMSLMGLAFEPGEDGAGRIVLTLAGDGALGLDVECINVSLRDVTRPYRAVSGKRPEHPE